MSFVISVWCRTALILVLLFGCFQCLAQTDISKLTRKEKLRHYRNNKDQYLPNDLIKFKILILDLTAAEVKKRHHDANYQSYVKHGIDTLSKPEPFLDSELEHLEKLNSKGKAFPLYDKTLRKKLNLIHCKTLELKNFDPAVYRYLIDVAITSTKDTPETLGFVISYNYFIVDRLTGKRFKTIEDDAQISLGDLID